MLSKGALEPPNPHFPSSFCFLATIKRTGLSHATMMCRPKATMPRGRELQSWILQGQRNLYYLKSVSSQFLYSTAMETKEMWKVGVAALAVFSSYNPPLLLLLLFSTSSPMSFWTREPENKVELKFPVKWKICFDASSSVLSTSVNGCVWTGPASQGSWPSQAALQPPVSGTLKGELLYPSLLTAVGAGHCKLSKHHFTGWIWHLSNKIVLERQGADS